MNFAPPQTQLAEPLIERFAEVWGLDLGSLLNHLISQVKQVLRDLGRGTEGTLDELALAPPSEVAKDPSAAVEAVLTRPAVNYRNRVLEPGTASARSAASWWATGRQHPRTEAHAFCTVAHLGLRSHFRIVDHSVGGLGLEGPADDATLELGADCRVRIHSGSTVIVRGARCVRLDHKDGKVRVGLQFHFPHSPPRPRALL